jgi:hypothetical protein
VYDSARAVYVCMCKRWRISNLGLNWGLWEGGEERRLVGERGGRTAALLCWEMGWSGARHSANGGVLLWGGVLLGGPRKKDRIAHNKLLAGVCELA